MANTNAATDYQLVVLYALRSLQAIQVSRRICDSVVCQFYI